MGLIERIGKIADVLNSVGEINSRKKTHKIVYLLQKKGDDFGQDFIFHYYGVYSPTLASDLNYAKQWQVILEKSTGIEPNERYIIQRGELFDKFISAVEPSNRLSEVDLCCDLNKREPSFLEALSTIVYLKDKGYSGEALVSKLHEIKGHLGEHFEEAFEYEEKRFSTTTDENIG